MAGALTLPMALRLSPAAFAGGTPVVLVTADTQSRVAAVDLTTGVIFRSIETAPGPRSIESVSGIAAVVCHTAHGQVSLIDGPSLRVGHVLRGFGEPRYTAAAPNGRHVFVTDSRLQEFGFAGSRHVWVSSGDRGRLAVYDRLTRAVLRRLPADAPPQHVTFLGGRAFVTSGDDGTLRVQSLQDGQVLNRTKVPVGSYNVQEVFGHVVTPSLERGTLCVLDRVGRLTRRLQVAPSSRDACFVVSA
jgi:DNA-binding beta-propeller fold protein YncE